MTERLDALERLARLRAAGAISAEDYEREKQALLNAGTGAGAPPPPITYPPDPYRPNPAPPRPAGTPAWLWVVLGLIVVALLAAIGWLLLGTNQSRTEEVSVNRTAPPPPAVNQIAEAPPAPTIRSRPQPEQLAAAFRAAFGDRAIRDVDGASITFRPGAISWIGERAVLVSPGTNAEECHACPGMVAIHYLEPEGAGLRRTGEWLSVATDDYGAPPEWRLTNELTGRPALRVANGGGNQGIFCDFVEYFDLGPGGPASVARVQTGYTNEGEEGGFSLEGRMTNIRAGESFDMAYTGYETFTETWRLRGGRFAFEGAESRVPTC
jgi:hypothetical protein